MRSRLLLFFFALFLSGVGAMYAADKPAPADPKPGEPTDAKARKTWDSAVDWEKHHGYQAAIHDYRKANQQDGGRCTECLKHAYVLALQTADSKTAAEVARDMLAAATPENKADAHYLLALALQREGQQTKKDKCFSDSCDEFRAALDARPDLTSSHYSLGVSLAYLHRDDDARREFESYVNADKSASLMHMRAERFLGNISLARARMAPPFVVTTIDGQRISMDALAGKVVLIDFWATWCGPCREYLPTIKRLAEKFSEQPLVILSVSLDKDEAKWKEFVEKNHMTWAQYRDGGWDGPMARQFGVTAIPATFTVDADGIVEDQHVGDADIEGKLKKLVAHAAEEARHKELAASAQPAASSNP